MSKSDIFEPPCDAIKELDAVLTTATMATSKDGKDPIVNGLQPTMILTRILPQTDRVLLALDMMPDAHGVGKHIQFFLTPECAEYLAHQLLSPPAARSDHLFGASLNGKPGKPL